MNKILLAFVLIGLTIQTCTKGCLKCTSDNKCLLCDATQKYKLASDSCSLADQPNCDIIDLNGDCVHCSSGYWLNTTTKKCVVVETAKVVTNCQSYTSTQTCEECKTGFIIEAAVCKALENPIANCDSHKNATACDACKSGYFVSRDEKTCEIAPTISNCNRFSRYECSECIGTHILNRNLYFNTSYKTGTALEKAESLDSLLLAKEKVLVNNAVCQEIKVENCAEYETFNTCKTCADGHFLKEDKTCQVYPISIILNCSIYSSNNACATCNAGFYRVSSSECKAVTAVDNCSEYSTTANTTQCLKCNPDFYLSSASSCTARVISAGTLIANCKSKQHNADKCLECNTGFVLASGGDQCAAVIVNCKTHNSFSKGTTPTCNTCLDTFYLSNASCVAGNVANCVVYNNNGTCNVCKNAYYINANECTQHQNISNCKTYNNSTKDTCNVCENNTFNFKISKKCKLLPEIANCTSYNHDVNNSSLTAAVCSACASGYFLNGGNSCDVINVSNCAQGSDASTCTVCKEGYVQFNNGSAISCVEPLDFMTSQCNIKASTTGSTNLSGSECESCKLNAIPFDYQNKFACVNNDKLTDTLTFNLVTPIAGCLKYDTTAGANNSTCRLCENSKYLVEDDNFANNFYKSCVSSCDGPNSSVGVFERFNSGANAGNKRSVTQYNICYTSTTADNIAAYAASWTDNEYIDFKCKSGKVTKVPTDFVNTTKYPSTIVNQNGNFGNWVPEPADQRVSVNVECPTATVVSINGVSGSTLITNCEYYHELGTVNTYGCVKCRHGYAGKATTDPKYLSSCDVMTECDSSISYGNMSTYWARYFSCHKCLSAAQIPYLFYKADTANANSELKLLEFKRYTVSDTTLWTPSSFTNNENFAMKCLTNGNGNKSSFRTELSLPVGVTDPKIVFVENCGLGLFDLGFNTNSNNKVDFDATTNGGTTYNSSIYCAICKPGFKPTFGRGVVATPNIHNVTACTPISNCTTSTWFNACSQCNSGFVFKYDNATGIDYTECVAYTVDTNCYAATANNVACSLCKKGFYKNKDGYCVSLSTPKCSESADPDQNAADKEANFNYMLWYSEKGAGCNQCESNYTAVLYNSNYYQRFSCANSSYILTNGTNFPKKQDGSTKSDYINHCESYVVQDPINSPVCDKCNANYVIRDNGSECVSVANCLIASNAGLTCISCKDGFGLVSGTCVAGNVANCAEYNTSTTQSAATCTLCNKGFYLTNTNTCLEGGVAFCEKHTDNNKNLCDECENGYFKISKLNMNANAIDYCYKNDATLECGVATISEFANGANFTCATCAQPYSVFYTPSNTEIQTMCLAYNLIQNCDSYNIGTTLLGSSLLCSVCKSGFYTSYFGSKCLARTVTPASCKTYQNDADLCSECNAGSFLSANQKECILFPSGVIGCTAYSNATTCIACGAGLWLSSGSCVEVLNADKVANCELYSNATTCSQCLSGFTLEANTCVALNVANCLLIANKDACQSCLPGFRLKTENGKTTCESFTKANCVVFDQTGTNPCLVCNQNFYVDENGNCVAVTPIITNCLVNDSKDTCELCAKGFALAKDKKSCLDASAYDSNCDEIVMPENMSCSQCSPGYYFKDGVCTAFTGMSIANGCFSQHLDDPKVCLFCTTGYTMNSSGSCIKNDAPTPVPEPENTGIIRSLIMTFFCLMFMI